MISNYMEDIEIQNPFTHLKPWQKTPYEKAHGRNIYKNSQGKYFVEKIINKEKIKTNGFDTFAEAIAAREELIQNNWELPETIQKQRQQKEYYQHIALNNKHYSIQKHPKFYGSTDTIEKALYYRDLCQEHQWEYDKKPAELDLITNNPYLENGLDYPVPERLIRPVDTPKPKGYITRHSPQSNQVRLNHEYFGSYPTYEMAWYVLEKLRECDFDKSKLKEIVEDYPLWYTWLMNLYKFVNPRYKGWVVSITPKHSSTGKLDNIYFHRLEDALWERDLLVKYGFDEELLVECADDEENPYYDMNLPPYPERKIRNISGRKDRTVLLNTLYELIQSDEDYSQEVIAELAGTTSTNVRNILRNEYNIEWVDFKKICENGENPNDVLEQVPIVYQPDLEIKYNNTNYVSHYTGLKTPYLVYHRDKVTGKSEYFGAYPSRELANKISDDLQAVNWDKSQLKKIQAKYGWKSVVNSKQWVYPKYYTSKKTGETYIQSYQVRRKHIGCFGTYKDKRVAELVRDQLIWCDWNKDKLPMIQDYASFVIDQVDNCWRCVL